MIFKDPTAPNVPILKGFRLRGYQGTRMDGLTDGIFALAVAVLLISSSVPTNYDELIAFVYDLFPFSLCIVFIYWIWSALMHFNQRYGLEDQATLRLKMMLMFFVLFYIYPLKFLMSWQVKYFSATIQGEIRERYAEMSSIIPFSKITHLMIIYGTGFSAIFFLFFLLYRKAYRMRAELLLNPREMLETYLSCRRYFVFGAIGVFSVLVSVVSIALDFALGAIVSGVSYNLIWIFVIFENKYAARKRKELTERA